MDRARQVTILKAVAIVAGIIMLGGVALMWIALGLPDGGSLGAVGTTITIAFVIIAVLSASTIERWRREDRKG
jgi:multisubunit Na+/H+ antiporter MnhB subunit